MLNQVVDRRNSQAVMGLGEHLDELRRRVAHALFGLVPVVIVACIYGKDILQLILTPANAALKAQGLPPRLQVTGALEGFSAYFYIVILATVTVGAPWIMYQVWKFIAPGLYQQERRFAYVLAPLSTVLTIAGVALMYFVMLPLALAFLIGFSVELGSEKIKSAPVEPGIVLPSLPILKADPDKPAVGTTWYNNDLHQLRMCVGLAADNTPIIRGLLLSPDGLIEVHLKVDQFVDLFVMLTLVFALCFQMPVVVLLLGWLGFVTPKQLGKWRKFAFAGSVVVGALVSPTGDPISLAVLQIPMYLLYELGILLLRLLPAWRVAGTTPPNKNSDTDPSPDDATGP